MSDTTEWRYTASSGEVVRMDGVLIARDVPEAFGPMVEAMPALLAAADALWGGAHPRGSAISSRVREYIVDKPLMDALRATIARARP